MKILYCNGEENNESWKWSSQEHVVTLPIISDTYNPNLRKTFACKLMENSSACTLYLCVYVYVVMMMSCCIMYPLGYWAKFKKKKKKISVIKANVLAYKEYKRTAEMWQRNKRCHSIKDNSHTPGLGYLYKWKKVKFTVVNIRYIKIIKDATDTCVKLQVV